MAVTKFGSLHWTAVFSQNMRSRRKNVFAISPNNLVRDPVDGNPAFRIRSQSQTRNTQNSGLLLELTRIGEYQSCMIH